MALPLLLPLLLSASLQAGSSTNCDPKHDMHVKQPIQLSAPEGGSIHIPFSFCHRWQLASGPSACISWRWKGFNGEFIYNTTPHFIHKAFKNRLSLNWTEGSRSGFLRISNLQREDESTYFCRVYLTIPKHRVWDWQSFTGTKLTITQAPKKTTQGPTSITATTADGPSVSGGNSSSGSGPLSMDAVVSMTLFSTVLKMAILGLIAHLRWKRNKVRSCGCGQRFTGMSKRGLSPEQQ